MFRLFPAWLLLAAPPLLAAEPPAGTAPLTLTEAANRVLDQNPRLKAGTFRREAAAAELEAAGLNPQWSLELDVEDILGTGIANGLDASQTTLSLARIFRTADFRDNRMSLASARRNALDVELESERLDLLSVLARRYLDVVFWQEQRALLDQSVTTSERATGLALERERAGAATSIHRLRAEMQTSRAKLELEDAEHELAAARTLLAATWGATEADFGTAAGSLCSLVDLASFESLAQQIEANPDLLRFATEQRLHEAEALLAAARNRPAWSLSAGVRYLALTDDAAFVVGASVPLGGEARAKPEIRQSRAFREQSILEEQQALAEARATLYDLYLQARHSTHEVEVLETEILPKAEEVLAQAEDGYRLGRFGHLELMNAQAELLEARAARLDACTSHHRFLIDIERLTGGGDLQLTNPQGERQ